jgi:hypothetical protein
MQDKHYYKEKERGRGVSADPVTGVRTATLECSKCPEVGHVAITGNLLPPDILDKKFGQRGWELDPHICPGCLAKAKAEKAAKRQTKKEQTQMKIVTKSDEPLADNPVLKAVSVDTHKATAKMHRLLTEHFDTEEGVYSEGWNDDRVAKESGMSASHVTEVRNLAYGELKEPDELIELKKDIKALHDLISETLVSAQKEVNALNKRADEIRAKLGFK